MTEKLIPEDEDQPDFSSKFVGSIFEPDFVDKQRAISANHHTVAFDLDDTLRVWDEAQNTGFFRSDCQAVLDTLKKRGYQIVLYSASKKPNILQTLQKFPEITQYFDLIISAENFHPDLLNDQEWQRLREINPKYYEYIQSRLDPKTHHLPQYDRPPKDISFLGYDILIEDDPRAMHDAKYFGYACQLIPSANFENIIKEGNPPVTINDPEIHREYFARITREIINYVEHYELSDLEDQYVNNNEYNP